MKNYICPICLSYVNLIYYKSKNCKCNIRYHLNCVYNWYKVNNICIYCKKKDNNTYKTIECKINKNFEMIIIIIILIIIFIYYIYYANYK